MESSILDFSSIPILCFTNGETYTSYSQQTNTDDLARILSKVQVNDWQRLAQLMTSSLKMTSNSQKYKLRLGILGSNERNLSDHSSLGNMEGKKE